MTQDATTVSYEVEFGYHQYGSGQADNGPHVGRRAAASAAEALSLASSIANFAEARDIGTDLGAAGREAHDRLRADLIPVDGYFLWATASRVTREQMTNVEATA